MKLRELLKTQDVNMSQLARKIGCTKWTVSNWCNDKNIPNANKITKIAKALNVSEQEILDCFK